MSGKPLMFHFRIARSSKLSDYCRHQSASCLLVAATSDCRPCTCKQHLGADCSAAHCHFCAGKLREHIPLLFGCLHKSRIYHRVFPRRRAKGRRIRPERLSNRVSAQSRKGGELTCTQTFFYDKQALAQVETRRQKPLRTAAIAGLIVNE